MLPTTDHDQEQQLLFSALTDLARRAQSVSDTLLPEESLDVATSELRASLRQAYRVLRIVGPVPDTSSDVLEDLARRGRSFEDGNALIEKFLHGDCKNRKNDLWEVWDFVDQKLVGEFETDKEAVESIKKLYAEKFDRVRYLVNAPHNVLIFPGRIGSTTPPP